MKEEMNVLATRPMQDYELLDSGDGEKLERFGAYILRRPDPQALWQKSFPHGKWDDADAHFVQSGRSGNWKKRPGTTMPDEWVVEIAGLKFSISLKAFKHTGIFPEQAANWQWINDVISKMNALGRQSLPIKVLNLFGYTGGATLAAAKAGAEVTHIDASKVSVAKASENAKISGLENAKVRWLVDDALEFVKREARRGNTYQAIIMDPPSYGHGPKKEVWKIEESLPQLIAECKKILSPQPLFVILNGYAAGYSALAYNNNVADLLGEKMAGQTAQGTMEYGELALETEAGRKLPAGIYARWRTAL